MRHLLKYPKMLLMDYLLTKKLSPKCCFDMSYQEQSLRRDCSYQHSWRSCRRQNWNTDVQIWHC